MSIITTCRQGKWRRIPLLLLAEGDIIALSAGDIAPGDIIELVPTSASIPPPPPSSSSTSTIPPSAPSSSSSSSSSSHHGYSLGNSIKKGTKILLRQHTTCSTTTNTTQGLSMGALPQKSIPSTSPDLLSFTGTAAIIIIIIIIITNITIIIITIFTIIIIIR